MHTGNSNQQLVVALLFVRAHQSFRSAILPAENGFNGDARALIRSAAESAIAIIATGKDAAFVDRLIETDQERRMKWADETLTRPSLRQGLTSEELDKLRELLATMGTTKPKGMPYWWH